MIRFDYAYTTKGISSTLLTITGQSLRFSFTYVQLCHTTKYYTPFDRKVENIYKSFSEN